jgi:hypothetical protein
MANDEMPRIVKIGATLRHPEDRLNDARSTTWAPTCYRIIAQVFVEDAFAAEQALHTLLAHRRLEARREFFRLTHAEARALFAGVCAITQPATLTAGPESAYDQTGESEGHAPNRDQSGHRGPRIGDLAQGRLRSWVESNYTHIPLREKDTGTKLEALYTAYLAAAPPVHAKALGRNTFSKLLSSIYPNVGPHKNSNHTVSGLFLLR